MILFAAWVSAYKAARQYVRALSEPKMRQTVDRLLSVVN